MTDDVELLRRYANERSEEAFTALVQRHLPLVYHAALRRTNGDRHLAEDVAQAVFANLAKEAVSLQRHEVLAGWLYVATRHAAANAMRTELRRKTREQEALTMSESSVPAVSGAEWEKLRPELDCVMDELSEADRNAVLLRFFENRPYAEIGASFRISEDAARMRVDRALEKLRTLLGRRGITSTAAALGGLIAAQSAGAAPVGLAAAVAASALVGGTATGSAGIVAFMTTNKIMMGIAGAVAFLGVGTALYEFQESRSQEAELAIARSEQMALRSQLDEQERRALAAAEKLKLEQARTAELEKSLFEARGPGQTKDASSTKPKAAAPLSPAARQAKLFANPEYAQLQMKITEKGLRLQYGPLYRKLGWSEDKVREFERLKLQEQQNMFDIMAAAGVTGVSMGNPAVRAQWEDPVVKQIQKSLSSLIGEKDEPAYREYDDGRMSAARNPVDMLAGNLYYTDTPLTFEQASKLTQLIVAGTPKPVPVDGVATVGGPDWESIYTQAGVILTARQLDTLRAGNERNQLFLEANALEKKILDQDAAAKN